MPLVRRCSKLHSANPIELPIREIKPRTDVVGIFPNEAAITRLIGVILLDQREEWSLQDPRYMMIETPMIGNDPLVWPHAAPSA